MQGDARVPVRPALRQVLRERWMQNSSKGLGPSTCAVENAQDLDRVANQPVWHDERRPRDHEFACSRNSTGSAHLGSIGQQAFNIAEDVERNTLRGCRIVLLDIGPQRDQVGNGLRRPDWYHERLGTGFSFALPHEATQSLTRCCGTPSPRSPGYPFSIRIHRWFA